MPLKLRQEEIRDHKNVFEVIKEAFEKIEKSDQSEHFLVDRLRKSEAFIPELSIVAEQEGMIVGHILLTKLKIKRGNQHFPSLALAPVSVLPKFQGKGIGSKLIKHAHIIAIELGFKSVMLIGHKDYYPRFGYMPASKYGISFPFEVANENAMAIELVDSGLKGISGEISYPNEFSS